MLLFILLKNERSKTHYTNQVLNYTTFATKPLKSHSDSFKINTKQKKKKKVIKKKKKKNNELKKFITELAKSNNSLLKLLVGGKSHTYTFLLRQNTKN